MQGQALRATALYRVLREELAPRPGRFAAVLRIGGSVTLVVVMAMLYQIPLPAYMAYIVFLIAQQEAISTLVTGLVAMIAVTLAVLVSLLAFMVDAGEPALRLPLMAIACFAALFLTRLMTLGPLVFLTGFILVLSQTLIDVVPDLEILTHLILWLWVIVLVPTGITVLVNLAMGERPGDLIRRGLAHLFAKAARRLRTGARDGIKHDQAVLVRLWLLSSKAGLLDRGADGDASCNPDLFELAARLLLLIRMLPPQGDAPLMEPLATRCVDFAEYFSGAARAWIPHEADLVCGPDATAPLIALADCLNAIDRVLHAGVTVGKTKQPPKKPLLIPGALHNPDHRRFALKTTIAVMLAYVIYSMCQWPGISTAITTCFFVALGSVGETVHKLALRLGGAVIGGLGAAFVLVWVIPRMTDIGQLAILVMGASCLCAWVATSSERIAYLGMQMAFAFYLGVLQGYGPNTDLIVLRDRIMGILLGNILMTVIFSLFWPIRAVDRYRQTLGRILSSLSDFLKPSIKQDERPILTITTALVEGDRLRMMMYFDDRKLVNAINYIEEPFLNLIYSVIFNKKNENYDGNLSMYFAESAEILSKHTKNQSNIPKMSDNRIEMDLHDVMARALALA